VGAEVEVDEGLLADALASARDFAFDGSSSIFEAGPLTERAFGVYVSSGEGERRAGCMLLGDRCYRGLIWSQART
jgi:hypothetical protein